MSEGFEARDEVPTVEVRVFRHGNLVHREWCESMEQAALVTEAWADYEDVTCEVEELSGRHLPGEVLEPTAELLDEDYAEQRELDTEAMREA